MFFSNPKVYLSSRTSIVTGPKEKRPSKAGKVMGLLEKIERTKPQSHKKFFIHQ